MNIRWFGHACFRLETKDLSLLIDPFPKEIGLKPPRINDQIVLVSHDHFDHSNIADVLAETFVIRGPGEYEKKGIYVQGIESFHDNTQGTQRGFNTIFVITMEDMRIAHLGDLGQDKLTSEQIEELGDIDILMIPVGGKYTINGSLAVEVVKQVEPKIIIPMHYKVPGLTIDIEGNEKFLKEIGLPPEEVDVFKILKKNLPVEELKVVKFKL